MSHAEHDLEFEALLLAGPYAIDRASAWAWGAPDVSPLPEPRRPSGRTPRSTTTTTTTRATCGAINPSRETMPNTKTTAHRSIPFTAAPFIEGGSGLLEPNLDRIEASPFVCFATTQEPVYKLVGHRTVHTPDEPAPRSDPKSGEGAGRVFSEAEVAKMLEAERRAIEHDIGRRLESDTATLRSEVERLRELASGGDARVRLERKALEAEKRAAEQARIAEQLRGELRTVHTERDFSAAAAAAGITNPNSVRAAFTVFRADAKLEYGADGRLLYVEVDGRRHVDLGDAVSAWAERGGRLFRGEPKSAGGGSSRSAVPLYQRSTEENINEANRQRASRRA